MIQPLRTTHRVVFLFLPIVLAAVYVSGLTFRYPWPAPRHLPTNDVAAAETTENVLGVHLKLRWLSQTVPTERKVQLIPAAPVVSPDLLVYWSEDSAAKTLPSSARPLGSYHASGIYTLPAGAHSQGYLVLYSLAHREVVASFPLGAKP